MRNPSNEDEAESRAVHGQETTQIRNQNATFQPTQNDDNEKVDLEAEISVLSLAKRRKLEKKVLEDCANDKQEDGRRLVTCERCKEILVCSSKSKSTVLKNHLARCTTRVNRDGGGDKPTESCDSTARKRSTRDSELNHSDVAQTIVKHGVTSLLNSMKADIVHLYNEEMEKLYGYFGKLSCRFSLTVDCLRRSSANDMYCCLRVQFIDDSWELQKKVIGFRYVHSEASVIEIFDSVLSDWDFDSDSSTIVRQGHVIEDGKIKSSVRLNGAIGIYGYELLDMCRLAHHLNYTVREGTRFALDLCEKSRNSFDYVRKISANEDRFQIAVDKAKSLGKKVTSQSIPELFV